MNMPTAHTRLITPPPFEPVTLEELRKHSVVEFDDDDQYLMDLLRTCREKVEDDTGRALVSQTWEVVYTCFPALINLPRPPLLAVESIKYYDTDGIEQTLAPATYQVSSHGIAARIAPAPATSWPGTQTDRLNAVTIRFQAGYVDLTSTSPPTTPNPVGSAPYPLKQAIMVLAAHLYLFREVGAPIAITSVPMSYAALLEKYELVAV